VGQALYNLWASVPDNMTFVTHAIHWARNDYDADNVDNGEDNCPLVANTSQANANFDFEDSLSAREIGDACDPSPVGRGAQGDAEPVNQAAWLAQCTDDPSTQLSDCALQEQTHNIELFTTWWSQDQSQTTAPTALRYCICRDADGNPILDKTRCAVESHCHVSNSQFVLPEGLGEPGQTRWLRMTAGPLHQSWDPENGQNMTYPVGTTFSRELRWNWEADSAEWEAAGFWSEPVNPPLVDASPYIAGLLWTHNQSVDGSDEHFVGTGVPHVSCADGVTDQCGFGNDYEFWSPTSVIFACPRLFPNGIPEPVGGDSSSGPGAADSAADARFLPAPQFVLDVPLSASPDNKSYLPFAAARVGNAMVSPGFAVPCDAGDGRQIAQVTLGADLQVAAVVTDVFAPDLRDLLLSRSDVQWVPPSEPVESVGSGRYPVAVAVGRATGLVVVGVEADGAAHLRAWYPGTGPLPASSVTMNGGAAVPTAYSRVRGELAQLVATLSGAPLDRVRVGPLGGSATERELLPEGDRPMTVRALTVTPSDGRLWVVGSIPSNSGHKRLNKDYLFIIDTGSGRIEAKRRLLPTLANYWLTTSARNEVVLVAAPKAGAVHWAVVFEPQAAGERGRVKLSGIGLGVGRVLGAPRVSADVLLVPVARPGAAAHPTDPRNYHVAARQLAELRARLDGSCFDE
jgi:hypothetical protein